jgi:hypothetical protein
VSYIKIRPASTEVGVSILPVEHYPRKRMWCDVPGSLSHYLGHSSPTIMKAKIEEQIFVENIIEKK